MVELISIHIPKTGGTSFYNILSQVYGNDLSISYKRKDIRLLSGNVDSIEHFSKANIKVLHGHFHYNELRQMHQKSDAKIICWFRDPVDRLISNYKHFIKRNSGSNPIRPNSQRINESLLTYARRINNQNTQCKFLEGIELNELFFFGFLESFESDLLILSQLLGWKDINIPRLNVRSSEEKEVSAEVRNEIRSLNVEDQKLYIKALSLRRQNQ